MTNQTLLSAAEIEALRSFDTPTVSNALELIDPSWDRVSGIMSPTIKVQFPEKRPIVGYASTVQCATRHPASSRKFHVDWPDYWRYILTLPKPRVSIVQDLDAPLSAGSLWGEIQTNIHMALGCVGVVIEGAIRDLEPMQALDYPSFAREVMVGHAHAHLVDFGNPVEVGGVLVSSGDLMHGDLHGVIVIPATAVSQIIQTCQKILDIESKLLAVCKDGPNFTLDRLIEAYEKFSQEYPEAAVPPL